MAGDETKMDTKGIDPVLLQKMDDLVLARLLAGEKDPIGTTSCIAACLAQMLADPTPEQAASIKKHLMGHVAVGLEQLMGTILGKMAPGADPLGLGIVPPKGPIDPSLN